MASPHGYALDAAKEVTIAALQNKENPIKKETGEEIAEFFEAVYKKVYEIAKSKEF